MSKIEVAKREERQESTNKSYLHSSAPLRTKTRAGQACQSSKVTSPKEIAFIYFFSKLHSSKTRPRDGMYNTYIFTERTFFLFSFFFLFANGRPICACMHVSRSPSQWPLAKSWLTDICLYYWSLRLLAGEERWGAACLQSDPAQTGIRRVGICNQPEGIPNCEEKQKQTRSKVQILASADEKLHPFLVFSVSFYALKVRENGGGSTQMFH